MSEPSFAELKKSEWSHEFEAKMRNRLLVGAYRHGRMKAPGKPQYDRITSAIKRLKQFQETGNMEHLVDAANLCLLEFVEGDHPKRHFKSADDVEHTPVRK
jgi:hypothetical protein